MITVGRLAGIRVLLGITAGLVLAERAFQRPVPWSASAVWAGAACSLLAMTLLLAGGLLLGRCRRNERVSRFSSAAIIRGAGTAYRLWFLGHGLLWTGLPLLATGLLLRLLGSQLVTLVLLVGITAAAAYSALGLSRRGAPGRLLAVCWQFPAPALQGSLAQPLSFAETTVSSGQRFAAARRLDSRLAQTRQDRPLYRQIQDVLDLERVHPEHQRLGLRGNLPGAALHELRVRATTFTMLLVSGVLVACLVLALLAALSSLLPPGTIGSRLAFTRGSEQTQERDAGATAPTPTPTPTPGTEPGGGKQPGEQDAQQRDGDSAANDESPEGESSPDTPEPGGKDPSKQNEAPDPGLPSPVGSDERTGGTEATSSGQGAASGTQAEQAGGESSAAPGDARPGDGAPGGDSEQGQQSDGGGEGDAGREGEGTGSAGDPGSGSGAGENASAGSAGQSQSGDAAGAKPGSGSGGEGGEGSAAGATSGSGSGESGDGAGQPQDGAGGKGGSAGQPQDGAGGKGSNAGQPQDGSGGGGSATGSAAGGAGEESPAGGGAPGSSTDSPGGSGAAGASQPSNDRGGTSTVLGLDGDGVGSGGPLAPPDPDGLVTIELPVLGTGRPPEDDEPTEPDTGDQDAIPIRPPTDDHHQPEPNEHPPAEPRQPLPGWVQLILQPAENREQ